jgi:hypothetical protein
VAERCEICGRSAREPRPRCECGYDFTTGDVGAALVAAQNANTLASARMSKAMLAAFAGLPGSLALGLSSIVLLFKDHGLLAALVAVAALVAAIMGVGGLLGAVVAGHDMRRATRMIEAAQTRRLPPARVVKS